MELATEVKDFGSSFAGIFLLENISQVYLASYGTFKKYLPHCGLNIENTIKNVWSKMRVSDKCISSIVRVCPYLSSVNAASNIRHHSYEGISVACSFNAVRHNNRVK